MSALSSAATLPLPGRPLRGLEHAMVALGDEMGPDLIVARIDGPLEAETVRQALVAVVARHAILRATLVHRGGVPNLVVLPAGDTVIHVRTAEGRWQDHVDAEVRRPIDLRAGAPVRATVVRDFGTTWLLLAIHHALVDGTSLYRVLHEVLVACVATPAWPQRPLDRAAVEHFEPPWWIGMARPVARYLWARELAAWEREPLFAPRAPLQPGGRVETLTTFRRGSLGGFGQLRAACTRRGVTVGGALMAASTFAVAREARRLPRKLPVEVEVNLRSRAPRPVGDDVVGFWTSAVRPTAHLRPETGFWPLARALSTSVQRQLAWGVGPLAHHVQDAPDAHQALLGTVGPLAASGGAGAALAVSNVGRWPYPTEYGDLRLAEVYGLNGACRAGPAVLTWLRFVDGVLFYNTIGSAPAVDAARLARIQDGIVSLLETADERPCLGDWAG